MGLFTPLWMKNPEKTKQLTDPQKIKRAVLESKNIEVCKTALKKIDDQTFLEELALDDRKSDSLREVAIAGLSDQQLVATIVKTATHYTVREAAAKKLHDQVLIMQLLFSREDPFSSIRAERRDSVHRLLIASLDDQDALYEVAINWAYQKRDYDVDVCMAAVSRITDQEMLEKIAVYTVEGIPDQVQKEAIHRLKNEDVLNGIIQRWNAIQIERHDRIMWPHPGIWARWRLEELRTGKLHIF